MNIGRVVVGSSAALALVAAVGFGIAIFVPPSVEVAADNQVCMASQYFDDGLVGVDITNTSGSNIELTGASVGSHDGIEVLDSWVIRPSYDGDGIGAVDYTPAVIDTYQLTAIDGVILKPGEHTQVVHRLKSIDGGGLATGFRIDFIGAHGAHHSVTSGFTAGYYSTDPEAEENECGV